MPSENILAEIDADQADPAELEHILLSYFHRSTQIADDTLIYGTEDNPTLELKYSEGGRPASLRPMPAFRPEDQTELRRIIREQVLAAGSISVGRAVMFAAVPMVGWFRFQDEFQLIPVPHDAPRPPYVVGDHPFLLEVAFPSSANAGVNMLRRGKREREIELLCSLLLAHRVHGQSRTATFHWVYEPMVDGNLVSSFKQGGYSWAGASFGSDLFSTTDGLPPLPQTDPQTYYSQQGVRVGQTLGIPANFVRSLELIRALSADDRERFLRASYWYQQSFRTWLTSRSIAFEALVCSVEALMPAPKPREACATCGRAQGPGPTRLFAEFIDKFVPDVPQRDRSRFYSLRSAISHGGKLLHSDEVSWGIGLEQANQDQDMRMLSGIVRAALINWLHTNPPRT